MYIVYDMGNDVKYGSYERLSDAEEALHNLEYELQYDLSAELYIYDESEFAEC